jgi:methylglutaconyl-CoA hydratase
MGNYQALQVAQDPRGVMTVTLNRPEVRNAFNDRVIGELARAFGVDALEAKVRVVVLRGAGSVFCAGGDLQWMKSAADLGLEENYEDTRRLARMFAVLNECPKPVIGAIHGAAIGGGVGLASVCDIVLAVQGTQFSLSEVRLGIIPACIGPFVIAKIGASHARNFFMSAERFDAARAREIGLVHEVVADSAGLDAALAKTLANILQCGPNAMAAAKKLVLDLSWPERRAQHPECLDYVARMLAELRVSAEGQEGLRAFLEKRKPSWLG